MEFMELYFLSVNMYFSIWVQRNIYQTSVIIGKNAKYSFEGRAGLEITNFLENDQTVEKDILKTFENRH